MPRPISLSPDLLRTFMTVARCEGDAAEAARVLKINQPSMSKRLAYFQHSGRIVHRPWLERDGKTWRLTEEGRRMLPAVEDMLRRYDQLLDHVGSVHVPGVTFACGKESADQFVPDALLAFRRRHPDVQFRISTMRGHARIEGVANGQLDLALVRHSPDQIEKIALRRLHVEDLFDDALQLVCAAGSPWAEEFRRLPERVSAKALAKFPLILPEPDSGLRQQFDQRLAETGVLNGVQVLLEIGGWSTLLTYVKLGLGVGLLPRSVAGRKPAELLVKGLHSSLAAPNVMRMICRLQPNGDKLDLDNAGQAFRAELLASARAFMAGWMLGKKAGEGV